MGCHTWFSRPVTQEEFKLIKEYAPTEIYNLCGDSKENIDTGIYDKYLYDTLMKSYNENIPCVYGLYWWQLGYGASTPELLDGENNYVHMISGTDGLYIDVKEYHDTFRVKNYPKKIIHSRKELRRWMGKKYFELEECQFEKVSEFFKKYPNGVIRFG